MRDAYAAQHGYDLERIYEDLKVNEAASQLRRAARTTFNPEANRATTRNP